MYMKLKSVREFKRPHSKNLELNLLLTNPRKEKKERGKRRRRSDGYNSKNKLLEY